MSMNKEINEIETLLAEKIRSYPILYVPNHRYRSYSQHRGLHENAWDEIAEALSIEKDACKTLWFSIKQKFVKYRKTLSKNGKPTKEWPLYTTLLSWLDEHIAKRRSRHEMVSFIVKGKSVPKKAPKRKIDEALEEDDDNFELLAEDSNSYWNLTGEHGDSDEESVSIQRPSSKSDSNFKVEHIDPEISPRDYTEIHFNGDQVTKELSIEAVKKPDLIIQESSADVIKTIKELLEQHETKLESTLNKCSKTLEDVAGKQSNDSFDLFGKYLASLIRELPIDKRTEARFEILKYAEETVAKFQN